MAHVEIHQKDDGRYAVIVDGVDIGKHVLHDGFSIQPTVHTVDGSPQGWEIRVRLHASSIDVDLPSSVVIAERDEVDA